MKLNFKVDKSSRPCVYVNRNRVLVQIRIFHKYLTPTLLTTSFPNVMK